MLTPLDEALLHQVPLAFEQAGTSDHRFFDRIILGAFHPDGVAAFILGMGIYKNMNVIDGFLMAQSHSRRQYNVRFSKALRPLAFDLGTRIGPLATVPLEPFRHIRASLEPGDYPLSLQVDFRSLLPAKLESPHVGRLDGRLHTDYLRYHQLGEAEGRLTIDGESFEIGKWFAWRDHSWGIRPFIGGFEPSTGTRTGSALPSALRSGGNDIMVVHAGFWNGREGGGIQFIENGAGKRLYTDGAVWRAGADEEIAVKTIEHGIRFHPGKKVFDEMDLVLSLDTDKETGEDWKVSLRSIGRPWVYRGGGYDHGFFDGKGHGVWRSNDLLVEQDVYDVSDVEAVTMAGGGAFASKPAHREQFARAIVNGREGFAYSPCIVIGSHSRYGIGG